MALISGLVLIAVFAVMLWSTQHKACLHIAIASAVIPAATLFGQQFGLSGGFLIAIGVMGAEILICVKHANRPQNYQV